MTASNFKTHPVLWLTLILSWLLCLYRVAPVSAQTPSSRIPSQVLGSLQVTGEATLNGTAAVSEQSVFPKDLVRTGANGGAVITLPGVGMMTLEANTEVAFLGDRYLAALHQGTLDVRSYQAGKNVEIQFGKMVMYLPFFEAESAGTVTVAPGGAGNVLCRAGQVGVSAAEGTAVVFLKPGQSVGTTAAGEIGQVQSPSGASGTSGSAAPQSNGAGPVTPAGRSSHGAYILLGAGVAAGAGVGIALALQHHNPVSPTTP